MGIHFEGLKGRKLQLFAWAETGKLPIIKSIRLRLSSLF